MMDAPALSPPAPNQGRKYKSRKERPCDACRRRKVCCIREDGDDACSLCRMQNTECRYLNGPTPRKRRPAASSDSETITSIPSSTPSSYQTAPSSTKIAPPSQPTHEWISQYAGLSADMDPYVLRHCNFNRSNYYVSTYHDFATFRVGMSGNVPSHFTLVPDSHLDSKPAHYPPSTLLDEAYPLHHELLTAYFEAIHTSFPLLEPARFTKGNKIDLPLLAAMYSLALPFCTAARNLSYVNINSFIFHALPIETRTPRLETIEAALLFLQRHTQIHRAPMTPGLCPEIGSIVGMAYEAGLNVDPSNWDLSQADRSRRKRLWWGLFIFDKWSALGLGRPSYISDDDNTVPLPIVDDIAPTNVGREPLPHVCAQMFVAMAALSQILSSILSTFYTLKGAEHMAVSTVEEVERIKSYLEMQLTSFHDSYLASISQHPGMLLDATGTLWLAYYTAQVVLFRAVLRCLPATEAAALRVRERAKHAVASISELLENLRVARLRAFWWSPISRINYAIAGGFLFTMLLSSITEEDIDYWSNEIVRYRRLLDLQSLSFDTTKLASARMSALANVSSNGRPQGAGVGRVDPKQAFCRDFGVELNTI